MKIRRVVAYEHHFEDFLKELPEKVQDKIFKVIEAIETLERVPVNFLKQITSVKGLYEARIQLGNNIWRVFCFFDDLQLVILINGFQKKTEKTPKKEIEKAKQLMNKYLKEKK
jgi:phage-related protein